MSKKTAVVLHNRLSDNPTPDEYDVIEQAELVKSALQNINYDVITLAMDLNLEVTAIELKKYNPDFVFNLVESIDGSGQLIYLATALLEHLGIPYTGCPNEAIFATSNKLLSKKIMTLHNILTPETFDLEPFSAGRYIKKSIWEHASIGLNKNNVFFAEKLEDMEIEKGFFAEKYIEGREFNLSILAGNVLPPAEIIFSGYTKERLKIVDYKAKWDKDSFEYNNTPRTFDFKAEDAILLENLKKIALKCWHSFNLRGYARVDFRVDENNTPYVLEINSNPCISADSGFYAAAEHAGLNFNVVIKEIISDID